MGDKHKGGSPDQPGDPLSLGAELKLPCPDYRPKRCSREASVPLHWFDFFFLLVLEQAGTQWGQLLTQF